MLLAARTLRARALEHHATVVGRSVGGSAAHLVRRVGRAIQQVIEGARLNARLFPVAVPGMFASRHAELVLSR